MAEDSRTRKPPAGGRGRGRGRTGRPGGDGGSAPQLDRSVCTPCRGTGKVISGLGGEPHEVSCPWCGGSGRFQPGRDAQTGGSIKPPAEAE